MYKEWVKFYGILLIVSLLFIGSLNFFMDPFWTFSHSHKYNNLQKGTNERQQKANHIYFSDKKYDSLLLGSSRTTYMNRNSFVNLEVFNFSASGMRPKEYYTYIDFVVNKTRQPIENIIIGMDFFGYYMYGLFMFDNAPLIVETTQSIGYRWKTLFSFDALNNSFKNLRDYQKNRTDDRYNRDIVKVRNYIYHTKEQVKKDVKNYSKTSYSSRVNKDYQNILSNIRDTFRNKNFIIYTTPVSEPLFLELILLNQYHNYENWLRELVRVFDKVYHFMYLNTISKNYIEYFSDSNHAYTKTNDIIAKKVSGLIVEPNDFGMILTKENIEEKLKELRKLNGINP
ncbi:MAG: hypothetical protein WCY75_10380 [Sulfurimonadaceae bacterium]